MSGIARVSCLAMACAVVVMTPSPGSAQMTMTIAPDFAMAAMMRQVRDTNDGGPSVDGPARVAPSGSAEMRSPSVSYEVSVGRRRTNLARFVEKTRVTDPVGAAQMQQLFASTDIIGMIDQKMQQTYSMRANNVADAYAVWWVSAWMGAKGLSDDATPGQMVMVKRQATDAGKQQFRGHNSGDTELREHQQFRNSGDTTQFRRNSGDTIPNRRCLIKPLASVDGPPWPYLGATPCHAARQSPLAGVL